MLSSFKVLILLFHCAAMLVVATNNTIFCYYAAYGYYRHGRGQFGSRQVDPYLCTHVAYAFFGINEDGAVQSLNHWLDIELKNIERLVALKKENRNMKVLASVGGWSEGSVKYSSMAADQVKRSRFINSVVAFLKQHGLDGMDLHWRHPAQRGGKPADRENYTILIKELKAAFKQHAYLLTAAVGAAQWSATQSYNIQNISQHLDLMNVMTFDFHGPWENFVNHNAPVPDRGENNVVAAINYWLSQGAPASKLVMGIPFYGRTYTLTESSRTYVGSTAQGPGLPGTFTNESGLLAYYEICANFDGWTKEWDSDALVPYAYKGNQWLSYDNVRSIAVKLSIIKKYHLAGAMVWSVDTDDFLGTCAGYRFPLLCAINNGLNGDGKRQCLDYDESVLY